MLKVEGADPGVLSRRRQHHVELLRPLIDALTYSLVFESSFASDDDVHVIRQSRSGAGSFALHTASGDEYHFRRSKTAGLAVDVLHAYRGGSVIATLRNENQARSFIRRISKAAKRATVPATP